MIAPLYHAHHSPYQDDLPFWLALARRCGGPVLELGCGTGRVLVPLAEAGFKVLGLDRERGMLHWLQGIHRERLGCLAAVLQADMGAFRLAFSFSLIILPCNTLSSLPEEIRRRMYACVAAHLKTDGFFTFSIANPLLLQDLPRRGEEEVEDEFLHPLNGNPVQVSSAWRKTRAEFLLQWHYDHLSPDGMVERTSVETRHTLQGVESYQQEMQEAGLRVVESWGDFEGGKYEDDSEYWVGMAEVK